MGFFKGANTFEVGKLKLGSTNIDRIYFGSDYVWPPIISLSCAIEGTAQGILLLYSCAIEGTAQGVLPLYSCAIEGTAQASIPLFSCAIEGNAVVDNTIVIDGLTYKAVTNPITGRTWLDRNLGATEVAQDVDSIAAQGWLYQWGRLTDGHQDRGSSVIYQRSDTDTPDTPDFIASASAYSYDWRFPQNDNFWQGVNGINNPGGTSGFRLPTLQEWEEEVATWQTQDLQGAFNSTLKLPITKFRRDVDGNLVEIQDGYYWASDTSGIYAGSARTREDGVTYSTSSRRASAMAVRLILDEG